ncbi:hypothetical protein A3B60_02655 [Candidatus Peregrinibacteria bacterium RIFCSPLOWO2_01_FULL_39_12]|nr:MAG: hypothetical protein A3B60_02655 [Candidatus Peregrinibacteria bacterium RIFCSPLOWO2_01_FULL_39_12]
MDAITEKPFDLEQFKQDLQELARNYTAAAEAGDRQECEDTFEALLHFGSEAFTKAKDEESRTAIEAAVKELKDVPDTHTLWIYMMGYGINKSTLRLYRNEEYTEQETSLIAADARINIIAQTARLVALKACSEVFPDLTQVMQSEFDSLVEKIISLPNRFQITEALEVTQECLSNLEKPLTTGPRALQAAGLRSYLKIYRAVMKRLCEISRRIPPNSTC